MKRLARYEGYKILKNRFFLVAALLFMAANLLYVLQPWNTQDFQARNFFAKDVPLLRRINAMDEGAYREMAAYFTEQFGPNWITSPAQTGDQPGRYAATVNEEYPVAATCFFAQRRWEEVVSAREASVKSAQRLGRIALAEGDDYNVRRNQAIIRAFRQVPETGYLRVERWPQYFQLWETDVLVGLLVIFLSAMSFAGERDAGVLPLTKTTRYGGRQIALAKLVSVLGTTALLYLLFAGSSLLMLHARYGLYGLGQPLSLIEGMELAPLNLTIGQYLLLFTGYKLIGFLLLAAVCCLLSSLSKSSLIALSCGGALVAITFLLNATAAALQLPEWIQLVNLLAMFRPEAYFQTFFTANPFSWPVLWGWIHLAASLLLLLAAGGAVVRREGRLAAKGL